MGKLSEKETNFGRSKCLRRVTSSISVGVLPLYGWAVDDGINGSKQPL